MTPITEGPEPYLCGGLLSEPAIKKATGVKEPRDSGTAREDRSGSCWIREGEKSALELEIRKGEIARSSWAEWKGDSGAPSVLREFGVEGYADQGQVVLYRNGLYINLWVTTSAEGRNPTEDAKALMQLMLPRIQITSPASTAAPPSATRSPS